MRVFVNERPLDVSPGATVRDAVRELDDGLATQLDHGAYATDGRGIRLEPDASLAAGAIIRVVRSARPAGNADT